MQQLKQRNRTGINNHVNQPAICKLVNHLKIELTKSTVSKIDVMK